MIHRTVNLKFKSMVAAHKPITRLETHIHPITPSSPLTPTLLLLVPPQESLAACSKPLNNLNFSLPPHRYLLAPALIRDIADSVSPNTPLHLVPVDRVLLILATVIPRVLVRLLVVPTHLLFGTNLLGMTMMAQRKRTEKFRKGKNRGSEKVRNVGLMQEIGPADRLICLSSVHDSINNVGWA